MVHVNAFVSDRPDSIWGWAPGEAPVAPVLAPKPAPPRAEAVTEQGSVVSEGVAVGYFGVYRVKDPANVVTLPPVLIMDGEGDAQRVDAILTKYNVRHETDIYPDAPDRHLVDDHVVHFLSRYLPAN